MVEWMELKTYLAPLFIKEVDSVSQKYLSKYIAIRIYIMIALIKEIRETNDSDKNEEYIELRNSINQRIEELDKFFEDNFDQPFVFNFEKGRIRLKKLLMYEPSLINQLDNGKGIKGLAFGLKPFKENMNMDNIITNGSYVNDKDKGTQSGTTTVLRSQNAKNKTTNSKVRHNRSMEKHKHNNESFDNSSNMVKRHNKKEQVYNNKNGNDYSYEDNSNCSHNTSHKNNNNNKQQQHKSSSLEYQMNESVTLTRNNNNNNHSLVEQSVSGNNNNTNNNNNNELLRGTSMSFKPNNTNTNNNVECTSNVCDDDNNNKHNKDEQPNEHEHINNEIREITLRFKLTEEEYRLLLREKAKIVVQLPEPSSTQLLKHSTAIPNLKKTVSKKPLKQKVNQLYHQNSSKYK